MLISKNYCSATHNGVHLSLLLMIYNFLPFSTTEFSNESNGSSKANQYSCININRQNDIINAYGSDSPEYWDTITKDDLVRNQYLALPYPAVTENAIQKEQHHYNSNKQNKPFPIYVPIILERINHFLFKGNNDFR